MISETINYIDIESFITTDNVLLSIRAFYHKSLQKCRIFCTEISYDKFNITLFKSGMYVLHYIHSLRSVG